jgi:hypothetical protein
MVAAPREDREFVVEVDIKEISSFNFNENASVTALEEHAVDINRLRIFTNFIGSKFMDLSNSFIGLVLGVCL